MRPRKYRIVLYSHDTMGLGHMRRNLLIAQTLSTSYLNADILMICGSREIGNFELPSSTDCLTLPAVHKDPNGKYHPRHLAISFDDLIDLRATTIRCALEVFDPDVLIVDKEPRGVANELEPTLASLCTNGRTHCVLGLRDILDDPATVYRDWRRSANDEAIRDYYDAVWVYGDPVVYDTVGEYRFSGDVAAKTRYVGYLNQSQRSNDQSGQTKNLLSELDLPPGQLVLCALGGGQDGVRLAEAFVDIDLPSGMNGVLLTGPFIPRETKSYLRRRAKDQPNLRVLDFVPNPASLIQQADRLIAMGGYNTVGEILSYEKRALVVPRVTPRKEQLIRAERLRDLGLVDVLHPQELSPGRLRQWLTQDPLSLPSSSKRIDMNALQRLPILVSELLASPSAPVKNQRYDLETHNVAV